MWKRRCQRGESFTCSVTRRIPDQAPEALKKFEMVCLVDGFTLSQRVAGTRIFQYGRGASRVTRIQEQRVGSIEQIRNRGFLKVVAKTLRLMETMDTTGNELRLTDLSKSLKMPKATVFRILFTLETLGYARQDQRTGKYRLTEKAGWLRRDRSWDSLRGVARPFMERLLSRFEQTVNLGVLDRGQILYIEILEGLRSIRMMATVNTYAPLHCTALGKSILAYLAAEDVLDVLKKRQLRRFTANTIVSLPCLVQHLKKIHLRGYAVDNEEKERGARCVAAPILNPRGKAVAGLSISGPISHICRSNIKGIAEAVIECCVQISERTGCLDPRLQPLIEANLHAVRPERVPDVASQG